MVIPEDLTVDVLIAILDLIDDPENSPVIFVSSEEERQYMRTALGYLSAVIPEAAQVSVELGTIH
jgi:hypothetical protein